eukprot:741803-Rhodomonas_salina.1
MQVSVSLLAIQVCLCFPADTSQGNVALHSHVALASVHAREEQHSRSIGCLFDATLPVVLRRKKDRVVCAVAPSVGRRAVAASGRTGSACHCIRSAREVGSRRANRAEGAGIAVAGEGARRARGARAGACCSLVCPTGARRARPPRWTPVACSADTACGVVGGSGDRVWGTLR